MTIQQWLFSFKRRIGRRDSWIRVGLWIVDMLVLFSLVNKQLLDTQTTTFCLVCLLQPTAAVTVKRLYDQGCSRAWALSMILAWILLTGSQVMLPGVWQWAVGHFVSALIPAGMLIDLDVFIGTQGANKYGKGTQDVKYRTGSQAR